MKFIYRKRNLENYTVRNIPKTVLVTDSDGNTVIDVNNPNYYYGKIPEYKIDKNGNFILDVNGNKIKNTININICLTHEYDDMGMFTDNTYIPKKEKLIGEPEGFNGFTYGRLAGAPVEFYYSNPTIVDGETDDSYLKQVKSYRKDSLGNDIYSPGLNTSFDDNVFNGVISEDNGKIIYKIGANKNNIENTGVEFTTFKNEFFKTKDIYGRDISYLKTNFVSKNGGMNQYNTTLSASTKKEDYLGVVFKPEVDSVVFINRGVADIFERHAILSEIKSTNDIDTNRGGFIKI
jgi:hypothetical protein|tara:strand:- start:167 stop:1039 length:873 start_codon:yes stop_codon:yes gene_type:complete